MSPSFSDFLFITVAAWLAGAVVLLHKRFVRWTVPGRTADLTFYLSATAFFGTFAWLAVLRHEALNSHAYDLAIYDQVVWNLSQGRWFETSLEYYFYSFLGDHLSLFLALLAPVYRVFDSPAVLLVLQPLAMALAGLPVYWWARERLGAGVALSVGISYLLFTPLVYVVAIDFHDIVLAAPLLSFGTFYMLKGDWRRFLLCAVPALLVKEDVGLLFSALGAYWLLGRKRYPLGVGVAALGIAWAALAIAVVIPSFNPEAKYYYLGRDTSAGLSQEALLAGLLARPFDAISMVLTPEKARYLLHLLTPLGFIPLLGPGLLALAFPTLGYLLLRGESPQFLVITQYAAPIAPFFFYAAVRAVSRAGSAERAAALAAVLLVASAASYYLHSPGPLSRNFVPLRYTVSERAKELEAVMARIPPEAGVVAQSDLVPHLAHRRRVHMFPEVPSYEGIDYVIFDRLGNRYPLAGSGESYERAVAEVTSDPRFRKEEDGDGYLVLKRTSEATTPLSAVLGNKVRLYAYRIAEPAASGASLGISLYWDVLEPMTEDYSLFIHAVDEQGHRLGQWDGPPLGNQLPTSRWNRGSRLRSDHDSILALPAGGTTEYRLEVGLYDWKTLERLPVSDSNGNPQGNSVVIGAIPKPAHGPGIN